LRKDWAAGVAFVLFFSVFFAVPTTAGSFAIALVGLLILNGGAVFLLIRLGLLAQLAAFVLQFCFLENFPLTPHGSAWYSGVSLVGILLMAAIAFFAFYTSLGSRPVFGRPVLEE
jgi:hypothetical protein